ncbi:MAG TPA: ester cyclase [Cyclobacteriaceae bacterium]|nr:ester cyclase [Cyclobacteriaceae bacterium]
MKTTHLKLMMALVLFAMGFVANAQTKRNLKQEEANKKMVTTFYQGLFGDKDYSVIDKYIVQDYIQHNPSLADGTEALKNAVQVWLKDVPKGKVDFQHIAADGDLVFLHVKTYGATGKTTAIVEIFKVKDNRIVEHWDVIQEVPEQSANNHPMF